jgi:hypothetical protein
MDKFLKRNELCRNIHLLSIKLVLVSVTILLRKIVLTILVSWYWSSVKFYSSSVASLVLTRKIIKIIMLQIQYIFITNLTTVHVVFFFFFLILI